MSTFSSSTRTPASKSPGPQTAVPRRALPQEEQEEVTLFAFIHSQRPDRSRFLREPQFWCLLSDQVMSASSGQAPVVGNLGWDPKPQVRASDRESLCHPVGQGPRPAGRMHSTPKPSRLEREHMSLLPSTPWQSPCFTPVSTFKLI